MQILVGATGVDPKSHVDLGAMSTAFEEFGVNITSLQHCGKLAFVALKGDSDKNIHVVKEALDGNAWLTVKTLGKQLETGDSSDDGEYTYRVTVA